MHQQKLKAIDFFCGAGGLTRGFLDAGVEVIAGIDSNVSCQWTYELNNKPARFVHVSLQDFTVRRLRRVIEHTPPERLVFMACAPCRPFTQQRREGDYDNERRLLSALTVFIASVLPQYVVIENVPGIARVRGNSTYRRFLKALERGGYYYVQGRLNAKCFGVPQNRQRWIVIGSRDPSPFLPTPSHGPNTHRSFETVRNAIADLPPIGAGQTHSTTPNHRAAGLSDINLARLHATPPDGGGRVQWPRRFHLSCHSGEYDGHSDVYGRMRWDVPAPTLTCRCHSISNGRYGHPDQHRAISLREAARLQTFGDEYVFYGGSLGEVASQIGNAVPVRFAWHIARAIVAHRSQSQNGRHRA
jgi:DNA (cytosine-5)-methyltransferase 1